MTLFELIQKFPWKSVLSMGAYYVLPVVLLVYSFVFPGGDTFSFLGTASMILLGVLLFLKPVSVIAKRREITYFLQFRRQMGVATFWLALFHAAGFVVLYDLTSPMLYFDFSDKFVYGSAALGGMIVLALTSNDISVRFLKRNWKRVQMLAYPVLFLVLLHAAMANDSYVWFVIVTVAYLGAKWWEYKKVRGKREEVRGNEESRSLHRHSR